MLRVLLLALILQLAAAFTAPAIAAGAARSAPAAAGLRTLRLAAGKN